MNVNFDFSGKTALVLGGSRGIGAQVVADFLSSGAKTFYLSRNTNQVLDSSGALHIACDVRDCDNLAKLITSLGSVDFLINCVAINHCKSIEEIDQAEWDDVFSVNIRSYYIASKSVLPNMKRNGFGRIVNVSSIAGRSRSRVSGIHYTSTKSAIIGFTRQLANDVGKFGINVNVVCPSQTITDMLKSSMSEEELQSLSESIPVRRISNVYEQSQPILFLCSDAANYMNGCAIDVNGGQL